MTNPLLDCRPSSKSCRYEVTGTCTSTGTIDYLVCTDLDGRIDKHRNNGTSFDEGSGMIWSFHVYRSNACKINYI